MSTSHILVSHVVLSSTDGHCCGFQKHSLKLRHKSEVAAFDLNELHREFGHVHLPVLHVLLFDKIFILLLELL